MIEQMSQNQTLMKYLLLSRMCLQCRELEDNPSFGKDDLGSVFYQHIKNSAEHSEDIFLLSENSVVVFHSKYKIMSAILWQDAFMASISARTDIRLIQAKADGSFARIPFKSNTSRGKYGFGSNLFITVGSSPIQISTTNREVAIHAVDIFDLNVSFLIRLDTLSKYKLFEHNVQDKLRIPRLHMTVPLTRKNGHIYLEWKKKNAIQLTRVRRVELYSEFLHASKCRLLNLLHLPRPLHLRGDVSG